MADVTWPYASFPPRTVAVDLVSKSASPGRTISGKEQVLQADAGYWEITLTECRIVSNDDVLAWRELEALINGRAKTVLVPAYGRKFAPLPAGGGAIAAALTAAVALGAVTADIAFTTGGPPEPGQDFSVGEHLYRAREVTPISGDTYSVKFQPPAREAMLDGAAVEFERPVCRCRLKEETGMQITLDLLRFANPSLVFCEDGT